MSAINDNESVSDVVSFASDEVQEIVSNSGSESSEGPEAPKMSLDAIVAAAVGQETAGTVEVEEAEEVEINNDITLEYVHSLFDNWREKPHKIERWTPAQFCNVMNRKVPPSILYELHNPICKPFFDFDLKFVREFQDFNTKPDNVPTDEELEFIAEDLKKAIESMFKNDPESYDIYIGYREPAWVNTKHKITEKPNYVFKVSFRFWVAGLITNDKQLRVAVDKQVWNIDHWPKYALESLEYDAAKNRYQLFDPAVYSNRQKLNCMYCYKTSQDQRKLIPFGEEGEYLDYVASYFDKEDDQAEYAIDEVPSELISIIGKSQRGYQDIKPSIPELDTFLNNKFGFDTTWRIVEYNETGQLGYKLEPNEAKCLVDPTYVHTKPQSAIFLSSRINRNQIGCLNCLGKHGQRKLTEKEARGLYVNLKKYLSPVVEAGVFDSRIANHLLETNEETLMQKTPKQLKWNVFVKEDRDQVFDDYVKSLISSGQSYMYCGEAGIGKTVHLIEMYSYCIKIGLKPVFSAIANERAHAQDIDLIPCQTSLCSMITSFRKVGSVDHYNVILIDEISLVSSSYLNDLISIKHQYPEIIMIAVGQFKGQLPPVEPLSHKTTKYEDNNALIRLFDANYLSTTKIHRNQDPRYLSFISAVKEFGIDFDNEDIDNGIRVINDPLELGRERPQTIVTYSNLTKECINQYMMDKLAPVDALTLQLTKHVAIKLYKNLPMISVSNFKSMDDTQLYNGWSYVIQNVDAEGVTLSPRPLLDKLYHLRRQNGCEESLEQFEEFHTQAGTLLEKIKEKTVYITLPEIKEHFEVNYGVTCHKLQGATLENHRQLIVTNFQKYRICMKDEDLVSSLEHVACSRNKSLYDLFYLEDEKVNEIENKYKNLFRNHNWDRCLRARFKELKLTDVATYDEFKSQFDPRPFSFNTYGRLWSIDHVVPIAANQPNCYLLSNLKAVSLRDNSIKSDQLVD